MAERLPYDYEGQPAYREAGRDVWGEGNLHEPRSGGERLAGAVARGVRLRDDMNGTRYMGDPRGHIGPGRPYFDSHVTHMSDLVEDHARSHAPRVYTPGQRIVAPRDRGRADAYHRDDILMYPERNIHVLDGRVDNPVARVMDIMRPFDYDVIGLNWGNEPKRGGGGGGGGVAKTEPAAKPAETKPAETPKRGELWDRSTLVSPEQVTWARSILDTGKMPNGKEATAAQKLSARNMLSGYERDKNRGAVEFNNPLPSTGADGKGTPYPDYTKTVKPVSIVDRHNDTLAGKMTKADLDRGKKLLAEQRLRVAELERQREADRQAALRKAASAPSGQVDSFDVGDGTTAPVTVQRPKGMEQALREEREAAAEKTRKANGLVGQARNRTRTLMDEASKYGGDYSLFIRYYNEGLAKAYTNDQALAYAHQMMKARGRKG